MRESNLAPERGGESSACYHYTAAARMPWRGDAGLALRAAPRGRAHHVARVRTANGERSALAFFCDSLPIWLRS